MVGVMNKQLTVSGWLGDTIKLAYMHACNIVVNKSSKRLPNQPDVSGEKNLLGKITFTDQSLLK